MNADELQAELDKLWSRVASVPDDEAGLGAIAPPAVETGSLVRDASLEAMQLLRRQREAETSELRHLLALKERAVADLADQVRSAQAEILRLRQQSGVRDRQVLSDVLGVSGKLQVAQGALQESQERAAKEEQVLRDVAEKTRQQLAAEIARWRELEHQWNQREQQYLLDLKESQTLLKRAEEVAAKSDERARKVSDDLKDAKGAVEATLAGLLSERKERETADQERARALKRVSEVEEHFQELQRIWQEERKQWQELWDRERSGWDARQQELSGWESKLRGEREAWHADLRSKEEAEVRFAEQMAKNLRESSEATSRLAGALTAMRSAISGAPEGGGLRRFGAVLLAAAIVASGALPVWRYATRLRLVPLAAETVAADNATAIACDGSQLWISEWSGRLLSLDPAHPSRLLSAAQVAAAGPYHPTALAVFGETLWSVDTAQARILRHASADPAVPRDSWASPGPAPLALAHDGTRLWSYDAVNRTLYRHEGEGPQAQVRGFPLDLDVVPTSMQWTGPDLWLHDSKGHRLLRLRVQEGAVLVVDTVPMAASVVSIAIRGGARGRAAWALLGDARGGYSVQRLELKGR